MLRVFASLANNCKPWPLTLFRSLWKLLPITIMKLALSDDIASTLVYLFDISTQRSHSLKCSRFTPDNNGVVMKKNVAISELGNEIASKWFDEFSSLAKEICERTDEVNLNCEKLKVQKWNYWNNLTEMEATEVIGDSNQTQNHKNQSEDESPVCIWQRTKIFIFLNEFLHFELFLTHKTWAVGLKIEILNHFSFCIKIFTGEFIFEWQRYSVCSIRVRWQGCAVVPNIHVESSVGRQNLEKHFSLLATQSSHVGPKEIISAAATLHQSVHRVARQSQFNHRSVARRIHQHSSQRQYFVRLLCFQEFYAFFKTRFVNETNFVFTIIQNRNSIKIMTFSPLALLWNNISLQLRK